MYSERRGIGKLNFSHIFSIFPLMWIKFRYRRYPQRHYLTASFKQIGSMKSKIYLTAQTNLHPGFIHLSLDLSEIRY
jgi:hypothetical protein